jgi:hypothetical protein
VGVYKYPMKIYRRTTKFFPNPAVGLRCIITPRHITQLKTWAIPLISTASGKELCRPSTIFQGIVIGFPTKSKYERWYLTPCCGLDVHNLTHTLNENINFHNSIWWWGFINIPWKFIEGRQSSFPLMSKVLPAPLTDLSVWVRLCTSRISKLIFDTLLWAWGA